MNERREALQRAIRELRYDEMIRFAGMIASWLPVVAGQDEATKDLADELSAWAAEPAANVSEPQMEGA